MAETNKQTNPSIADMLYSGHLSIADNFCRNQLSPAVVKSLYFEPLYSGHLSREPIVSAIERFHCIFIFSKSNSPFFYRTNGMQPEQTGVVCDPSLGSSLQSRAIHSLYRRGMAQLEPCSCMCRSARHQLVTNSQLLQ